MKRILFLVVALPLLTVIWSTITKNGIGWQALIVWTVVVVATAAAWTTMAEDR